VAASEPNTLENIIQTKLDKINHILLKNYIRANVAWIKTYSALVLL